ncbi:MAG TPA: IS110 family transposase, partial [Stellaceae bacterium]|nr:IS110 family transposase [Stellaceae bacterium]
MTEITTIGLDLAKHVFQLHGVDGAGQVVVRRALRRGQVLGYFAKLAPCLVGMEACATAHHWGRELAKLGHQVQLIAPAYVKAYVRRNKSDAADAAAICEAVSRPQMRFVAIKTPAQQAAAGVHKVRGLLVKQRTMLINALRGLMAEFGIIASKGPHHIAELTAVLNDPEEQRIPEPLRDALGQLVRQLDRLRVEIEILDRQIVHWGRADS